MENITNIIVSKNYDMGAGYKITGLVNGVECSALTNESVVYDFRHFGCETKREKELHERAMAYCKRALLDDYNYATFKVSTNFVGTRAEAEEFVKEFDEMLGRDAFYATSVDDMEWLVSAEVNGLEISKLNLNQDFIIN